MAALFFYVREVLARLGNDQVGILGAEIQKLRVAGERGLDGGPIFRGHMPRVIPAVFPGLQLVVRPRPTGALRRVISGSGDAGNYFISNI